MRASKNLYIKKQVNVSELFPEVVGTVKILIKLL
jgi:hypothetical protein